MPDPEDSSANRADSSEDQAGPDSETAGSVPEYLTSDDRDSWLSQNWLLIVVALAVLVGMCLGLSSNDTPCYSSCSSGGFH
jgi:hypothetical protein